MEGSVAGCRCGGDGDDDDLMWGRKFEANV